MAVCSFPRASCAYLCTRLSISLPLLFLLLLLLPLLVSTGVHCFASTYTSSLVLATKRPKLQATVQCQGLNQKQRSDPKHPYDSQLRKIGNALATGPTRHYITIPTYIRPRGHSRLTVTHADASMLMKHIHLFGPEISVLTQCISRVSHGTRTIIFPEEEIQSKLDCTRRSFAGYPDIFSSLPSTES
jgi:hypothetical protein